MDSLTRLLLPLAAFLVILTAAACGDDDDDDSAPSATIEVNTTADVSERNEELSFREALELASGTLLAPDLTEQELEQIDGDPGRASADTITFDLEDGAVIELTAATQPLTGGNDTIEGEGNVTLDGSAAEFTCLSVESGANSVYGLRFTGCHTAVHITTASAGSVIGGPEEGQGNVFIDGVVGIEIAGVETIVQGNHIGVEPDGTEAHGNEFEGIWIFRTSRDNRIGGPGEGEGNVISGNELFGMLIEGSRGNVVQGNYFGLDTSGRVGVRNHTGLKLSAGAFDNLIGGEEEAEANIISGNGIGVRLTDENTTGNRIIGNVFGKSAGQGESIPNDEDIYEDEGVGENTAADNVTNESP